MKYGIREICEVVLKAKANMRVGSKMFYKNEPVIYFDSLKTSTMEGAATTVYAQGGRGNSRLIAWEGERTVTFTMEDALISTISLAILSGADVIDASELKDGVVQHLFEDYQIGEDGLIKTSKKPHAIADEDYIYVMKLDDNGDPSTEPYIYTYTAKAEGTENVDEDGKYILALKSASYEAVDAEPKAGEVVRIDYYTARKSGATQIEITPDKFGGNFYLEASTLFRNTDGVDMPAEFIIPNCKVQSNFTFTMASSGDPSTFTFTMDAFPDYTRFNKTKKVISVIQVIDEEEGGLTGNRTQTDADSVKKKLSKITALIEGKTETIVNEETQEEEEKLLGYYVKINTDPDTFNNLAFFKDTDGEEIFAERTYDKEHCYFIKAEDWDGMGTITVVSKINPEIETTVSL